MADNCSHVFRQFRNCEPTQPFQFSEILQPGVTDISQPGYVAGGRGPNNKDGSACPPVGYLFMNSILKSNSVDLKLGRRKPAGRRLPIHADVAARVRQRVDRAAGQGDEGPMV